MSAEGQTHEKEVLAVLDAWARALRDKDLDALRDCYATDVRVFDIGTQLDDYHGLRGLWEACFPYFPNPIGVERKELRISSGPGMAVVTFLSRLTGMESDHPAARSWFRATVCLKQQDGAWKIFHDHVSLPVDCGAERPTYLLDPD